MKPELLLSLSPKLEAVDLFCKGAKETYLSALAQGQIDDWARMMHAIINMVARDDLPRCNRKDLFVESAP
jgi:hypothetical protein